MQEGPNRGVAQAALGVLRSAGVRLAPGLSEVELVAAETELGFRFAPDHRELLALMLPTGPGWPDWRGPDQDIRRRLGQPAEGLAFDVVHNGFWPTSWGVRPSEPAAVTQAAGSVVRTLPVLVPLYRHRYVPAASGSSGPSPVFSVHQSDVIYYGRDIADYAAREFGAGRSAPVDTRGISTVPFWSDLALGLDDSDL